MGSKQLGFGDFEHAKAQKRTKYEMFPMKMDYVMT